MQRFRQNFRAMACNNVLEVFARSGQEAAAAADAAIAEVRRVEAKYSRYREDSVVSRINRAAGAAAVEVDTETAALIHYALACHRQSAGLFDITSGVLRRAWDFKSGKPPARGQIGALLPLIGADKLRIELGASGEQVSLLQPGMEIDFGGFGKEYAADRAAAVLLAHGVANAFVNLGGDVVVTGPQADGEAWQLGVRHPRDESALLAQLPITSGAVATSGDYERYFDFEGRRYSHILDPRSGDSVEGWQSVTVLAPTCLVAGSVTTIAMLKGFDHGLAWLRQSGLRYLAVDLAGETHTGQGGTSLAASTVA
jgi:thiamine biosynthesis lipoprotein